MNREFWRSEALRCARNNGADLNALVYAGRPLYSRSSEVSRDMYVFKVRAPLAVYKKALCYRQRRMCISIVRLVLIPGELVYMSDNSNKCRTSAAFVEELCDVLGFRSPSIRVAVSSYTPMFKYRRGEIVLPNYPFAYYAATCASGIHFYFQLIHAIKD